MSEVGESVQVIELVGKAGAAMMTLPFEAASAAFRCTDEGAKIIRAFIAWRLKQQLNGGEVSLDVLQRGEKDLSVLRVKTEAAEKVSTQMEKYRIPYSVKEGTNGETDFIFPLRCENEINAVLSAVGEGRIVTEADVNPHITSGEVSLTVMQQQEGQQLMLYKYEIAAEETVMKALSDYGIKYAKIPDINLKDAYREIAFPPAQLNFVNAMIDRIKQGQVIDFSDYAKNADKETVDQYAAEFEALQLSPEDYTVTADENEDFFLLSVPTRALIEDDPEGKEYICPLFATQEGLLLPKGNRQKQQTGTDGETSVFKLKKKDVYTTVYPDRTRSGTMTGEELLAQLLSQQEDVKKKAQAAKEAAKTAAKAGGVHL